MTITQYHPLELSLWRQLQPVFDELYNAALEDARMEADERAAQYDVVQPIWHRVTMPLGVHQEVKKKLGRVENELRASDTIPVENMVEEYLDSINYLAFAVAYLRLLDQPIPVTEVGLFDPTKGTPFAGTKVEAPPDAPTVEIDPKRAKMIEASLDKLSLHERLYAEATLRTRRSKAE